MIEGNLFSICASFPSIRRFFRLIAPRWISESERKSSRSNALDQKGVSKKEHSFRTFGAPGTRKQLDTLDLTKHGANEEVELVDGMSAKFEVQLATNYLGKKDGSRRIDTDDNVSECSRSNPSLGGTNPTWDSRSVGGEFEAERTIMQTRPSGTTMRLET
jgi:hypothetical protein